MDTTKLTENKQLPMNEDVESIKLSKNSRGYNWEIRLTAPRGSNIDDNLERLHKINNELNERYGGAQ